MVVLGSDSGAHAFSGCFVGRITTSLIPRPPRSQSAPLRVELWAQHPRREAVMVGVVLSRCGEGRSWVWSASPPSPWRSPAGGTHMAPPPERTCKCRSSDDFFEWGWA